MMPIYITLGVLLIAAFIFAVVQVRRRRSRRCPHCDHIVPPRATVCDICKQDIV